MIVHEFKTVFVHVPKAAGQSVENFLLSLLDKNRQEHGAEYLLRPNTDERKGPPRLAHLTAEEYTKLGYISKADYESYYTFTVVRNPWSRMVSFYKYRGFNSLIDFNTFVQRYVPSYFEKEYWFYRPQVDFIYGEEEELLVDKIAKLESLDTDFKQVADALSLAEHTLPKSNHSERKGLVSRKSWNLLKKHPDIIANLKLSVPSVKGYRDAYNDASKKVISALYEKDIDLLNYTF
ncbi:sulfotransferase family protein [Flavobacteriaceae bacterium TK19130]|nr:sulfotransferase family protein [Thermobacterium salinum]